ncbi:MAG: OmpA family protein [Myxococcota bacterium]
MSLVLLPLSIALSMLSACGPSYPNCDNDDDCHEAEYCVNGLCQQCRTGDDCPRGQGCNNGACEAIPGYCDGPSDCGPNEDCQSNRCVAMSQSTVSPPDTPTANDGPVCDLRPIYFAFDADQLDPQARDAIQANVDCMRQRGLTSLHLSGHADPRGTEEYNLALGDRRARSVMQYMQSLGVSTGTVTSSSMGEEMASGEDDAGYRRDRRVELISR